MTRFIRRGVAKFFYVPTIADLAAGATRAELDAGEDITEDIATISGFNITATTVAAPDMGSRFDKTIEGNLSVGDSSLGFYEDDTVDRIESLFPRGDIGHIVILPKGDKPTGTQSVFPVRVSSNTPNMTVDLTPANRTVAFAMVDDPIEDLPVPAVAAG